MNANLKAKKIVLGALLVGFVFLVMSLAILIANMDIRIGKKHSISQFFCLGKSTKEYGGKNGECYIWDVYSCTGIYSSANAFSAKATTPMLSFPCNCKDANDNKHSGHLYDDKCYIN